jgi:hypothetical protein
MNITFSFNIEKTYTRNKLAEKIISLAFKENLIVFGGYVRDREILCLNTFNDIDLACFAMHEYNFFLSSLKEEYLNFLIETPSSQNKYARTSNIISNVITIKVNGAYGITFPENMHISIDIVIQKSMKLWKKTMDIDFSCNLFYRDQTSIGIRYIPKIYINDCDPFTFWKSRTIEKKFYMVMENMEFLNADQIQKLLNRANKLIDKNWKMCYNKANPFTLGFYNIIKYKNQTQCSICLDDFETSTLIVNTSCKHSFCKDCFQKVLCYSNKCPNCRKVICFEIDTEIDINQHFTPMISV